MSQHTIQADNDATLCIDVDEVARDVPFVMVTRESMKGEQDLNETGSKAGFTTPLVLSWIVAILGSFQFGYQVGVTGAVKAKLVFPGHSKVDWSLCVSIFSIGGLLGAMITGRLCATWSRKRIMMVGAIIYVAASLVMGGAINIFMLTAGRFLVGLAGGSSTVLVPLYLKEIAPAHLRGTLGTGHQIAAVGGVFIAAVLAFGFAGASISVTNPGWRFLMGFTALTGVVQFLILPFVVESPSWLMSASRIEEASTVLARLRATTQVNNEIKTIRHAVLDRKDDQVATMGSVIRDRSIRRRLVIGTLLHVAMRFSGFNAVTFYANQILEQSGINQPLVGTALVGLVNFLATIIALVLIDKKGRRPLFILSASGMFVSSLLLTMALKDWVPFTNIVSVASVMGFVAFFEIGLGPIPWTLVPEIMPAQSRATAMSMATMVNWSCLFTVGLIFPTMQSSLGDYSFMPFAVCHLLALFLVVKFVPETKGKSVEEIADAMHQM